MAQIEGITVLQNQLHHLQKQYGKPNVSVSVGYAMNYALYVHENMKAAHGSAYNVKHAQRYKRGKRAGELKVQRGPNQQAKFLERPLRELSQELREIFKQALLAGKTLEKALLLAGARLLRASQEIVPVDTGALRASAFIAIDEELPTAISDARNRADAIRAQKMRSRHTQRVRKIMRQLPKLWSSE